MRWMCWVKDIYCEATEEYYVEYYCKAADIRIMKPKRFYAPPCFLICEKMENKKEEE